MVTCWPSILSASGLKFELDREKLFWSGKPVLTVSKSDWVEIISPLSPSIVAVTLTDVGTVPAVTLVLTCPSELVNPCCGESAKPPMSVFSEKRTCFWASGLPSAPLT